MAIETIRMQEERHIAKIKTSGKLLMKMLDLEGGVIWYIRPAEWFGDIEMLVEHPDLPLVKVAEAVPVVDIAFQLTYGEDGSVISIERVDPPKKEKKC